MKPVCITPPYLPEYKAISEDLKISRAAFWNGKHALWVLALLLAVWFGLFLGNRPFASPDEGRYVEIPREMVVSGDYITPRLNGIKYFEKPPLFYWVQTAAIQFFGIREWAMRLGCVFFAIMGCLGTYLFGRRFYGAPAGLAACLILAASPLYYALGRLIILDMAVTVLVSLSLFSFLAAVYTPPGWQRRLWAWGFYGGCALGVLTKGLMALAIPGPVILIWAASNQRWKDLWPAYLPSGLFLFLAIAAPWHILASLKNPEFAHKYFVVEHFMRYTTSLHMRTQPIYFFLPVLLAGFFPWITLLWGAFRARPGTFPLSGRHNITLFLMIWAGWIFAFFTFSNSKLIPYILPCFPPLALVAGACWTQSLLDGSLAMARQAIIPFAAGAGILGFTGLALLWFMPQLIDHRPYLWVELSLLAASIITAALLALFFLRQRRLKASFAMLPVTAIFLAVGIIRLMPELQRPSVKPLAQIIQSLKKPGDIVGSYKTYYQDLPPYLNQIVTVVDVMGELEFGCTVQDCTGWMIPEKKFLSLWSGNQRLLFVARASDITALSQREPGFHYCLLGQEQQNILITNQEDARP